MNERNLLDSLARLIDRVSSDLPGDVERALKRARAAELDGSPARWALDEIMENVALARAQGTPLCQDSGTLTFFVEAPRCTDSRAVEATAARAVVEATRRGKLRQNTIDALTNVSSPTNEGEGVIAVHARESDRATLRIALLMKGGGCENVAQQYSLPDMALGADRDLEGAFRCAMHTLLAAQGKGCAPGVLGLCIGADRAGGYARAKEQFLRSLEEESAAPALAALERRVMEASARLGIGPMGLGGRATLLGVKAAGASRLPASYFVTVSYMCWALRRQTVELDGEDRIARWIET